MKLAPATSRPSLERHARVERTHLDGGQGGDAVGNPDGGLRAPDDPVDDREIALDLLRKVELRDLDGVRLEVHVGRRERHPRAVADVARERDPAVRLRERRDALGGRERSAHMHVAAELRRVSRLRGELDTEVAERQLGAPRVGDVELAPGGGVGRGVEVEEARRVEASHEDAARVDAHARVDRAEVVVVDPRSVRVLPLDYRVAGAGRHLERRAEVGVVLRRHVDVDVGAAHADSVEIEVDAGAVHGDDVERRVERGAGRLRELDVEVVERPPVHDEPHDGRRDRDLGDGELAREEGEEARAHRDLGRDERGSLAVVRLDADVLDHDGGGPERQADLVGRDEVLPAEDALGLPGRPRADPLGADDAAEQEREEPHEPEEQTEHLRDDRPPVAAPTPRAGLPQRRELGFEVGSHRDEVGSDAPWIDEAWARSMEG